MLWDIEDNVDSNRSETSQASQAEDGFQPGTHTTAHSLQPGLQTTQAEASGTAPVSWDIDIGSQADDTEAAASPWEIPSPSSSSAAEVSTSNEPRQTASSPATSPKDRGKQAISVSKAIPLSQAEQLQLVNT